MLEYLSLYLPGFYIGPNLSLQNQLVRWTVSLFINSSQALSLRHVGLDFSNTPLHAQHYWAWCEDINGGWSYQ